MPFQPSLAYAPARPSKGKKPLPAKWTSESEGVLLGKTNHSEGTAIDSALVINEAGNLGEEQQDAAEIPEAQYGTETDENWIGSWMQEYVAMTTMVQSIGERCGNGKMMYT